MTTYFDDYSRKLHDLRAELQQHALEAQDRAQL